MLDKSVDGGLRLPGSPSRLGPALRGRWSLESAPQKPLLPICTTSITTTTVAAIATVTTRMAIQDDNLVDWDWGGKPEDEGRCCQFVQGNIHPKHDIPSDLLPFSSLDASKLQQLLTSSFSLFMWLYLESYPKHACLPSKDMHALWPFECWLLQDGVKSSINLAWRCLLHLFS